MPLSEDLPEVSPSLLLLISMVWPRPSRSQDSTLFCFPKDEAQRLYRDTSENPLIKEKIAVLEEADRVNKQQIANLEQQLEIQKKLTEIAEKLAEVEHIAYERQKELTDRAIKLAASGITGRNDLRHRPFYGKMS